MVPGRSAVAADTFLLKIKIHQFLVTHLVPEGDESSDSVHLLKLWATFLLL